MGLRNGFMRWFAIGLALTLATAVAGAGVAGASEHRAASADAVAHCKSLKDKIKSKKGKAKQKAKAKYKRCLEKYDEANPPGDGGGTTDPGTGGGTTDPGTGTPPQQQCTSLETCPQLTRNDAAGQQAMGAQTILERYSYGSSGQTAEYYRLFFYGGGAFKGAAVDWNSVSGEICRQTAHGQWSFREGYTYTVNGGGVLVVLNMVINGQSGTEVLDFRTGAGSSVYVGPNATHFEENPQAIDNC